MELLSDLVTLFLLGVAAWVFLPAAIRDAVRGGIAPAALALAAAIRSAAPVVGRAATWLVVGKVSGVSADIPKVSESTAPPPNSTERAPAPADEQTDEQTDGVSVVTLATDRAQFDRTRSAAIAVLVACGWSVGQVRSVIKGDNGAIGVEVEQAREALGLAPPEPPMLLVRDGVNPERAILK